MGIRGLFTELSRKGYEGESICLSAPEHRRRTIVVDASALIEEFSEGWEYSGNFVEVFNKVKEFVVRFRKAGISLVAVTDGAVMTNKMTEWKRRRADETKRMIEFFDITSTADSRGSGLMSVDDSLFSPPFGKETIGEAFRVCGCEVVASIGEADKNIARICHTRKCLGVMSGDSDFFAFRVPLLIKGDSVRFSEGEIFATCYELNKVASLLGVKPEFLPLLGTLNGNDYIPEYLQKRIRTEARMRYPSNSQLESMAALIHSGTTSGAVRLKPGNEVEWIKSVGFLAPYADKFTTSLTEYKIESNEKPEEIKPDYLSIIREIGARANETGHSFPHIVYCILGTGVMSSGVFLEAPPRIPTWQVYKAIRRRAYALLFSLRQSEALPLKEVVIRTMSFSTVYTDSDYYVEGVESPDTEFYDALPPKYKFSSYKEVVSAPFETQFELVLKALGLDDSLISMIVGLALKNTDHITFYVIAAAICYLNQQAAITHQSLQALLYQAHLLMVNPQVVFHVPQLSIDSDLTYEGSTYLHLFGLVKVVNSACGFPIPSFTLNKVYEGTLFYYIRSLIANGKTDKLVPLWGEDSALYEEAEAMSRSVLGTKDVPVRTIRGLKKKETKTSRKSKKAKAKSSSSRGGDKAKNGDKKLCSAFSALCLDDEE